jgi:multicomponent Na+:H+ antiporter subunit D
MRSGIYPPELRSTNLDVDWTYRHAAPRAVRSTAQLVHAVDSRARAAVVGGIQRLYQGAFRAHGPHGPLARSWPTGSMVFWVAVLLGGYLILALT